MKIPGSNPSNPYKGQKPPPSPNPPDPPAYKKLGIMQSSMLNGELSESAVVPAALLSILAVLEEILEELRYQNSDDQEEEQGPTSLSDR